MRALDDVTVLDLSHALAGPFCSTMLADYGAEVIKIEPPGAGDMARAWGPPFYGERSRPYFVNLHRNKKSVAIDLKHPDGKALFFRLLERRRRRAREPARRRGAASWASTTSARASATRGIIYCSISGFGQDGPYRDRAALDLIVQAESGMISVTGEPGGPGVRAGVSIADITAGMYAAFGIMLGAARARRRPGAGSSSTSRCSKGSLSILQGVIGAYLADGIVPGPMGTAYAALLPYQTFRTKTRDLALGVGSDKLWRTFCPLLGLPTTSPPTRATRPTPRATPTARRSSRRCRSVSDQELRGVGSDPDAGGVPVGAINTHRRVVEHPQVAARGALVECEHPVAGKVRVVGPPVRLSETPGRVRTPAPLLGRAHGAGAARAPRGLDDDEIARLRRVGAIG